MGRRRIESADAEIATRAARGESTAEIAAALGGRVSPSTVTRRMRELRDRASPERIKRMVAELVHEVGPERATDLIREFLATLTPIETYALRTPRLRLTTSPPA